MEQHYTLSRTFGDDDSPAAYSTFTVSDADAVNCAHMLAAGFNTMSRNMLNGWVLAVVDAKDGRVYYDGKSEQIKRDEPWSVSQTMHFEASPGAKTLFNMLDDQGNPTLTVPGNFTFADNPQASADLAKSAAGHIARSVLEAAYVELQAVKEVLYNAGCETIPADVGVRDLVSLNEQLHDAGQNLADTNTRIVELERRLEFEHSARTAYEMQHAEQNEATRVELIEYVKRAHRKKETLESAGGESREDLADRFRGTLDLLAKFLVVIGEAENDERHAVARRLCGIGD